jgi:adenosylcobinamide-GDP ribazoletransferase
MTELDPASVGAKGILAQIGLAFQFLTVAPIPASRSTHPATVGGSMAFFPLVGAALALVLGVLDAGLGLVFSEPVRVALLVVGSLLLTRAIHLDGLMDSLDGLFGGWTVERRLEIMHDSRVGSFGALGAASDILLHFAALLAIPAPLRPLALVSALALGRWSLVYATATFPYARQSGIGATYKAQVGRREVSLATSFALLATFFSTGWLTLTGGGNISLAALSTIGLFGLSWLVAGLAGRYFVARLRGQTGDTYGATNELVELAVLLVAGSPLLGLAAIA